MLNCTDELCHLHHHHDSDHIHHYDLDPQHQHQVMSSDEVAGDELPFNDSDLENFNSTETTDVVPQSHLDAPSNGLYTACGVLIAMLLVALIILLLALTISKLRKREESSGSVVQHAGNGNAQQTNCAANHQHGCVQHGTVLQQTELTVITASAQQPAEPPPFLWVYSSSNHSLDTQVHHSQDLLVRPDSCEVIDGECKNGIRKNLRGKWNRLVKKKPHHDIYAIPAELKPQLKQIYVY